MKPNNRDREPFPLSKLERVVEFQIKKFKRRLNKDEYQVFRDDVIQHIGSVYKDGSYKDCGLNKWEVRMFEEYPDRHYEAFYEI